jgi:FlaG/FlaF family flagellin (archaellin)
MGRGTSPLLGAIMLVLITIVISVIVSGFVKNLSEDRSSFIVNKTRMQLSCQYAGFYISNVTFECSDPGCFAGVPYKINATIENTGTVSAHLSKMLITMNNGLSYLVPGNSTTILPGIKEVKNFNSILIRNFTTNITFNISHPNLESISIYDENDIQIFNANMSGSSYDSSITSSSLFHKIEVKDASGNIIRKFHPFQRGGACTTTSDLDSIKFSSAGCPEIQDIYPGTDVFFVNCG